MPSIDRNMTGLRTLIIGELTARRCDQVLELPKGNEAAGEGESADEGAQHYRYGNVGVHAAGLGCELAELAGGHQRRCAAAQAVEYRHHLGHGSHLDGPCHDRADGRAHNHSTRYVDVVQHLPVQEGDHNGEEHTGGAQHVP